MPTLRAGKPAACRRFLPRLFFASATDLDVRSCFVPGGDDLWWGDCGSSFPGGKEARAIGLVLICLMFFNAFVRGCNTVFCESREGGASPLSAWFYVDDSKVV